ncbi:dCTP deaminase [Leuconostoc mesenteroides]
MILTGEEIIKQYRKGNINIFPFSEKKINPNSYNYTLNKEIIKLSEKNGNVREEKFIIPDEGLILEKNVLYLGVTNEKIGSNVFATSLIGRSSIGRLGIHVQISANLGHTGTYHQWTLEIRVSKNIRIYRDMDIGQVSFWTNYGQIEAYNGSYKKFNTPHQALQEKVYDI